MTKDKRHTEEDILQRAFAALKKAAPLGVEIDTIAQEPVFANGFRPDALVRMALPGKELKYCAEIKANLTKAQALMLFVHREKLPCPLLLVARHINAELAEELRQNGLEFIDTTGNVYINQPPVYIFVKGNRPLVTDRPMPLKRTFRTAGLRVIYGFLCSPGLENKTYREIAATTGVALGTVDWIIRELKELGFLLDMGKAGLKLIQKETLLQRWVIAYPEQLRPKQLLGRYRGQLGWWQLKKLAPQKAQWGGEVAAARLTKYLQPELITIYTIPQELNQFLLENRLRKDLAGDVEILERFWQPPETLPDAELVHPILVYADLLATGNQRNMDTAKMIYEQHIVRLIRED